MKTKTATIDVYTIRGTRGETCADVFYRAKRLHRICNAGDKPAQTQNEQTNEARAWAHANGFTHCRVNHVS